MQARVYFADGETDYFLKRLFHKEMNHVFVVIDGVLMNPCFHMMYLCQAEGEYQSTAVLDVEISEPAHKMRWPLQLVSCTYLVKEVLGIKKCCILTPYQLYKYLLRQKLHGLPV